MRVVSVLPSATEIVWAIGHGAELVGRSAECDFPAGVLDLPVVMRARTLDSSDPSAVIDARVSSARSQGNSLYELDIKLLKQLQPELLITQDLCGVCSVTEAEVAEACARAGVAPQVLSLTPRTLENVWASISTVAQALGDRGSGTKLRTSLEERSRISATSSTHPRVAVVEWVDPPILAGLWTSEIVQSAGGTSIGPAAGIPGERTSWPALATRDPDLLVISPCSFSVPRTLRELADPKIGDGVGRFSPRLGIFVVDEAYFSRPGPRLADGVELIRALIGGQHVHFPMPVEQWYGVADRKVVA